MNEKLISSEKLENDLLLEIIDASKKIAADRSRILIRVRVAVNVKKHAPVEKIVELESVLGAEAVFEKSLERFFVSEEDVENVTKEMLESYLGSVKAYLSRPDFPEKFLMKKYVDAKKNFRVNHS